MTDHLGPIDFIAIEFPDGHVTADGFREVLAQVEARAIFLIDLEFVAKDGDGALHAVPAGSLGLADLGLAFDGANSHLLSSADLEVAAADVSAGSIVALLIYEDRTLSRAIESWERSGARVVAEGSVDDSELDQALESSVPAGLTVGTSR